jgi:hypothetical protein
MTTKFCDQLSLIGLPLKFYRPERPVLRIPRNRAFVPLLASSSMRLASHFSPDNK